MLKSVLIFFCFIGALLAVQAPVCYPHVAVSDAKIYVGYAGQAYKYGMRGNLEISRDVSNTYADNSVALCGPAIAKPLGRGWTWETIYFSGEGSNPAWLVALTDLRPFRGSADEVFLPTPKPDLSCTNLTWGSIKYCYSYDTTFGARLSKLRDDTIVESIPIADDSTFTRYVELDSVTGNVNLVTVRGDGGRQTTNYKYHTIGVNPLRILTTAELQNTKSYGCPVAAAQCGVPSVLLDFTTYNDMAVWLWSNIVNDQYVVHLDMYDSTCKEYQSVVLGQSTNITRVGCGNDVETPSNGQCNSQACCDAIANPNYATGSGFYKYLASCKNGGASCVGNTGCQLCWRQSSQSAVNDGRPPCGF